MLVATVRATITDRGLVDSGMHVICACSGGPDSAALLYCLGQLQKQLGFELTAASVDHGLRPDAYVDLEIAADQALRLGVPFHGLRVEVPKGSSMQARAREARYAALTGLARSLGAERIAVGHTQDDQAETVLARMLRGSGVMGLGAIDPRREDGVVRPLLDCRRADVHALAHAKFPRIACDASNQDPKFERVRIRSRIVPAMLAEDAAIVRHLAELADDARACTQALDEQSGLLLKRVAADGHTLIGEALRSQPIALRTLVLRRFVLAATGVEPGRAVLRQLNSTLSSDRGEVWLAGGYFIRASGDGHLRLCAREPLKGEKG